MITPRLRAILDRVNTNIAADIGTDHAYIPIRLIKDGRARRVIATDIREGPAEISEENIKKYGLSDKIEVRLGNGLSVIEKGEADLIIIAGMGGELIRDIIASDEDKARASDLILQPMNSQYELRKYLIQNGFTIYDEDIAVEGFKVYNILSVKNGKSAEFENDADYHIPPYLANHKNFKRFYEKKKREFEKVVKGLENSAEMNAEDIEKLEQYKIWLKDMKKYEG